MKKLTQRTFVLVAALFAAITLAGCSSTAKNAVEKGTPLVTDSAIVEGKLDNGMTYFLRKNAEPQNRIYLRLVVQTGSSNEDDDQKGVAHFIEHMCFNGTESFEKNSLIDYFETIGMSFGPEVNAYTNQDETVYMLEIPSDNEEFLKNAILILHDWASAVTFDQEELDKERGVIVEEDRARGGLNGRIRNSLIPFLLKGSRYADRITIGDMDIIRNISRERVLDYYNKWYRPELMSVIITGDMDVAAVENLVNKAMGSIPASEKKIVRSDYPVVPAEEKSIFTLRDKEQPYTLIYLLAQETDYIPTSTKERLRHNLALNIGLNILNERFQEITISADSPWLDASTIRLPQTNFTRHSGMGVVPKDGMFFEGYKRMVDEYKRICAHGVTSSEVERQKAAIIANSEKNVQKKDTIHSAARAEDLVSYVTTTSSINIVSEEQILAYDNEILPLITVEEITNLLCNYLPENGNLCYILANEATQIPSDEEIMDVWKNYSGENIEAYVDDADDAPLMERPAAKAAIISKETIAELGTNKYVLENGLTIYTRPSDYEQNKIVLEAVSKGGASLIKPEDYPSAAFAPYFTSISGVGNLTRTQFQKKIASKQVSLSLNINNTTEVVSGSSTIADFETLLQIINLYITQPCFTDEAWNVVMDNANTEAKGHGLQPDDALLDKIWEVVYNKDILHSSVTPEFVAQMNRETSERIYRERFSNAADWNFIFTGDFNEDELIDLCCYYLGTLPGDNSKKEEAVYKPFFFPNGKPVETVKKGIENQGAVFMAFGGTLPAAKDVEETYKDSQMLSLFRNFMDIKLRESIREDKSGTYGVNVFANSDGFPERYYEFQIYFQCEPEREDELKQEVLSVINDIKSKPVEQTYIDKITEQFRREFEVNQRNNYWWKEMIKATQVIKWIPTSLAVECETVPAWITGESLQAMAKKYLNTDNFATIYLVPEK